MNERASESLTPKEKQFLIENQYEAPIKFINEDNKNKVKRKCKHCQKDKVGDADYHANFWITLNLLVPGRNNWKKTKDGNGPWGH